MFCINCGVELADSEKSCPLCGVRVYHPELSRSAASGLYPPKKYPVVDPHSRWPHIILTVLYLLPMTIVLLCDLRLSGKVSWSGYVVGAMLLFYEMFLLPTWFSRPNPVIFVPCAFAAAAFYLLYIDLATGGGWFLFFALPVTGGLGLIVTAVVTLVRYVRKGKLFIFGGAVLALGAMAVATEWFMTYTFELPRLLGWSLYPLIGLGLLGGLLIFLGICRPAREAMERKLFV